MDVVMFLRLRVHSGARGCSCDVCVVFAPGLRNSSVEVPKIMSQ